MAAELAASFYGIINEGVFKAIEILFIAGFTFWEIPRSIKIMSEEYTRDVYPEYGRVTDFFLFAVGLVAFLYISLTSQSGRLIEFILSPSMILVYMIVLVVIPLIILLGFFKRFFSRMESGKSLAVYAVNVTLDLCHTVFYVCFSLIVIPVFGYLLFGMGG